jgi:hypothetical protein
MNHPHATALQFEEQRTTLSGGTTPQVVLGVGIGDLASKVFRHDPPAPYEMEQAIDLVEDALAATGLKRAERADLLISDEPLCTLLGLQSTGSRVTGEEVEAKFQRLASVSLGHPGLLDGMPSGGPGGRVAAALLVLRECVHHLGFAGVVR